MNRVKQLVLACGLSLAGVSEAGSMLMVENAWIREAPPGVMAMAGYMTLHNPGQQERILVGAQSTAFSRVMLHRTVLEGGVSKMVHQHMIRLPAGEKVQFRPNDYHLMMLEPRQQPKRGDRVEVTLEFQNGETLQVSYEVRAQAAAADPLPMQDRNEHSHQGGH